MTDNYSIDTAAQLASVERSMTIGAEENGAVPTVQTLSQTYRTDSADLWEAVTTSDRLKRWFAPVSGDLRLGGRYQVEGNAGGTVESCDAPRSFSATWEFGGAVTHITVRIDAVDDARSRLTLEHSGATPREFFDQFGPGATGVGWELGMLGLAMHIDTGVDKPAENTEWGESDHAKDFMSRSSALWADAAVAAGLDRDEATGMAQRTTAFYTGAPA